MSQVIDQQEYTTLLNDLRTIQNESKQDVQRVVSFYLVQMYWKMGKRIIQEELIVNAGYGDSIIEDLGRDLGIAPRTLRYAVDFAELYPDPPEGKNLKWTHYRELLHVNDDEARAWYEKEAINQNLNSTQLIKRIRTHAYENYIPARSKRLSTVKPLSRPTDPSYIYSAVIDRIIDGDTIDVRLDLGFDVWRKERLRLAHIDTPEITTDTGHAAYDYVRRQLALHPNITIKTQRADLYGRYIADVFYTYEDLSRGDIFTKGRYLNGELVDLAFAVKAY